MVDENILHIYDLTSPDGQRIITRFYRQLFFLSSDFSPPYVAIQVHQEVVEHFEIFFSASIAKLPDHAANQSHNGR